MREWAAMTEGRVSGGDFVGSAIVRRCLEGVVGVVEEGSKCVVREKTCPM